MRTQLISILGLVGGCGAGEHAAGNRPPDPDSVPPIVTVLTLEHTKSDGDWQIGTVRTLLAESLKVRVMKGSVPIAGVFVAWSTEQSDAEFQPELSKSDAYGYARTFFTPGSRSGFIVVSASVPGVTQTFYQRIGSSVAATVEYAFGGGVTSEKFPVLSVMVEDRYGNAVENHPVTWTVVSGTFAVSNDTATRLLMDWPGPRFSSVTGLVR